VALPTFAADAGEGMAVSASALLERLLARDVTLDARTEWAELPFPVTAGTQVAVLAPGDVALQARVGSQGRAAVSGEPVGGACVASLAADGKGLLQVGLRRPAAGPVRAVVVALAPL
jgi:hypothetical protein